MLIEGTNGLCYGPATMSKPDQLTCILMHEARGTKPPAHSNLKRKQSSLNLRQQHPKLSKRKKHLNTQNWRAHRNVKCKSLRPESVTRVSRKEFAINWLRPSALTCDWREKLPPRVSGKRRKAKSCGRDLRTDTRAAGHDIKSSATEKLEVSMLKGPPA
ncbi:hypothetical protein EVAR_82453_1 [Eumeta japonica]|uniref:Uncharacterized protein n=1 Tax=Eumeta variegata TaxID=151549 RepID=A0A4C1X415_EUMVA|nr:hypothetical protein EVAR_82453_1 [Eumeta japonica]